MSTRSGFAGGARRIFGAAMVALEAAFFAPGAAAEEPSAPTRAAAQHFRRGVDFYTDADYRAALVEFDRAYALVPKADVLYNVGETQYELQDYAAALNAFERYLAETTEGDRHHKEVAREVDVLRKRVGYLTVGTAPAGADVEVDDRLVGKTPLESPIVVSMGHRKVAASMPGRAPVVDSVDVAPGEAIALFLQLPAAGEPLATAPWSWGSFPESPARPTSSGATLRTLGWIGTAALAAGAGVFGFLASQQWDTLQKTSAAGPASGSVLAREANSMLGFSVLAESLGAAAVVVGGVTLYATLSLPSTPLAKCEKSALAQVDPGEVTFHLKATY